MTSPFIVLLATLPVMLTSGTGIKPFPGVESRWEGFARHDFQVDGVNVLVVEPKDPLPGRPWAWRGEFFGAFPNADIELLKRGWHLAYIGVMDLFGSPKAMKHWETFYDVLVKDYRLSPKPALIGLSRGTSIAWPGRRHTQTGRYWSTSIMECATSRASGWQAQGSGQWRGIARGMAQAAQGLRFQGRP